MQLSKYLCKKKSWLLFETDTRLHNIPEWAAETALFSFSGLCPYFHSDPEKNKCLAVVINESKYVKIKSI